MHMGRLAIGFVFGRSLIPTNCISLVFALCSSVALCISLKDISDSAKCSAVCKVEGCDSRRGSRHDQVSISAWGV